ncbi:MAG TPA: ATP-binding protein, partial [Polyangiales bacterium]|nr:ATP-binding protein [Polyangiales bacterium]
IRRFSTTLDAELFYAAVPWPEAGGVIRAATPISTLEELASHRRTLLAWTGGLGLLVALLFSAIAAHLAASRLDSLALSARAVLNSGNKRIPISTADELGRIAGSVNQLAEQREQTIAELTIERDRRNAVLRGVNEGLIAIDDESRIELMNPAALRLLHLDRDPEGMKLVEAVRIPALVDLAERGKRETINVEFAHGDPPRHLLGQATPLRATGGSVLVLRDITEMRNMESMRRDLVANVSHELRTPVSIIRANAETLLDGALEDPRQSRNFVQAMLRHAERLTNLLSDLLDLARIEGGAYPLQLENIGLRQAAQRASDTLQRTAKTKGVSVRIDIDGELAAHADAQALDQVLVNLMDNAIKYSFEGGSVDVTATLLDDTVRIVVSDDGPGIQERHRTRIFERFYRVDAGRSRAVGGTGLGLSIVKHLVSLMHGNVGVDGVAPHGSAFWVSLPRAKSLAKPLAGGAAA